ncbi:MAG: hypothetical protein ACFB2X_20835 [Rivularia sp. (in: cyanobacteria)]
MANSSLFINNGLVAVRVHNVSLSVETQSFYVWIIRNTATKVAVGSAGF